MKRKIVVACILALTLTGCVNTDLSMNADSTEEASKENAAGEEDSKSSDDPSDKKTEQTDEEEDETSEEEDEAEESYSGDGYQVVAFDENSMKVTMEPFGEVELIPLIDKDAGKWSSFKIMQGDTELAQVYYSRYHSPKEDDTYYDEISEVGICDINFDGISDVVVVGDTQEGEMIQICTGEYEDYSDSYNYYSTFSKPEAIEDYFGSDFSAAATIAFLTDGHPDGQFDSYQEAYEMIASRYCLGHDYADYEYKLIYFDDDDVPELVIDYPGYSVSMYTFADGKLILSIDDWGYGAGGNGGYEYYPKEGLAVNYNTDYAGAILYTYYMTMDENYKVSLAYSEKYYNYEDKDGDGVPSDDELDDWSEDYEGKTEYECYTGEDLTQDEIVDRISDLVKGTGDEIDGLSGDENLIELNDELTAPGWKVTKLEGEENSFTVGGEEFELSVNVPEEYYKEFTLSNGDSQYQEKILCNTENMFLIEKANGKSYLYINILDEGYSDTLYVFDLNNTKISEPRIYEDYSLFYNDITDANSFVLLKAEDIFGRSVVKKTFTVGFDGMPVSVGKFEYYVGIDSINPGNPVGETGETIVTKKEMILDSSDNIDSDYYWTEKTIPAGSNLTLYKTDGETYVDLITDDGVGVRFDIEDGVICGEYTVGDFEDVPVFG